MASILRQLAAIPVDVKARAQYETSQRGVVKDSGDNSGYEICFVRNALSAWSI